MENMEIYWDVLTVVVRIADMAITGYLFCRLVRPFLENVKLAKAIGITYFAVIMVMYFIPYEMESMVAYAVPTVAAFTAMYLIDRRHLEQKIFLGVAMYLVRWMASGIAIIPRAFMLKCIDNNAYISARQGRMFVCYAFEEAVYIILTFLLMAALVRIIDKVYIGKKEDMSWKELGLMLAPLLSVLMGYGITHYYSNAYEADIKMYIWNVHPEYNMVIALYQIVSYVAIVVVIVFYQSIKESHRKENAVLAEQVASMESHISEVEALYRDIRGLKHDMGNHVTILENLVRKKEQQEAAEYLSKWKEQLEVADTEIKSGNPVTDVILTEKQKVSKEKGIAFVCDFHYPEATKINAFDVSVILNNAVGNAIEAVSGCQNPYIHVKSYRKKNAYMIEVSNSFNGNLVIDEESGLPESTKKGKEHGYGLLNIRKVAQKYFGDIDIELDGEKFRLSIMLMVE